MAGGYQIVTRPELHEWVRRLFHERSTQKLTVQALETLAVIAYKQPITALEITEIRGVNTSGVLSTLLERHLIKIVGRKNVVGRPFLYATTKEFLIRFGLKDLDDLPKIEDMAEALGFDPPAGLIEQTPPRGRAAAGGAVERLMTRGAEGARRSGCRRVLSRAGIASRRAAETLITQGRVSVNGVTVTSLAPRPIPAHDDIRVDGRRLPEGRTQALHPPEQAGRLSSPPAPIPSVDQR